MTNYNRARRAVEREPAKTPSMVPLLLLDDIKARMRAAMQARDEVAKNILGLAVGEIQTAEARANRALSAAEVTAILRKLVKSNEETLAASADGGAAATLRRENEVLSSLLPKSMSVDDIVAALAPVADALRAAKGDGQAMGVAMKHLKAAGAAVESGDVQKAVAQVRA
jgi:uncharacterized protein YqeY